MKNRLWRIMAASMAAVMVISSAAFAAETEADAAAAAETEAEAVREGGDDVLVVGYSNFSSKFSPFFAETAYDQDAQTMTQIGLITTDRVGQVIYKGIEGETNNYNGTDYTYYGPADIEVTENEDGTVFYDFTLRDDIVFSDGEPLTVDDVIFSMYVLCDPTYDGSSTLFSMPIEGLAEYRSGMDTLMNLLIAAGPDNTDFTLWDEATQTAFWEDYGQASTAFAQAIVDACVGYGLNTEEDSVAACAANWGYELEEDATLEDFWNTMVEAYEGDIATLSSTEKADDDHTIPALMSDYDAYTIGVDTGEGGAPNISGIQKTGDNSLRVVATQVDATLIYQLGVSIAPMHYYGDASMYDYDANMFGFPKGDLSMIRAKTTQPMGAGPYKFLQYKDGTPIGRIVMADIIEGWKAELWRIYLADPALRGKGYGKQAMQAMMQYCFEELKLERLYLDHYTGNPAAGLYLHLGFQYEGVLRRNCRKNGKLYDVHLMSMLREEYEAL